MKSLGNIFSFKLLCLAYTLTFLTSCSPPSLMCLYPKGNSHNLPMCDYCHKHWSGEWYENVSWRHEGDETEKVCPDHYRHR
jgi:hypothetical protein